MMHCWRLVKSRIRRTEASQRIFNLHEVLRVMSAGAMYATGEKWVWIGL